MTGENAYRLQASEVALNPEVLGELNAQAALEALATSPGFPAFTGTGSPEGVQVGDVGDYYEDDATGNLYNKATGTATDTGWVGPVAFAGVTDFATADTPTTVPADGGSHNVPWILAAPPTWGDNAGNITEPGLYFLYMELTVGVAATVPALNAAVSAAFGWQIVPVDGLALASPYVALCALNLGPGVVPFPATGTVTIATDVTLTLLCSLRVQRLAYNVP